MTLFRKGFKKNMMKSLETTMMFLKSTVETTKSTPKQTTLETLTINNWSQTFHLEITNIGLHHLKKKLKNRIEAPYHLGLSKLMKLRRLSGEPT